MTTDPGHVDYPHHPGYLIDCTGCESGPCVCAGNPALSPCVSDQCERSPRMPDRPRGLSGDERAVFDAVADVVTQDPLGDQEEISDGCARTIASWFAEGTNAGAAFASTGAISDPTDVYRLLVRDLYDTLPEWQQSAVSCLGTYLMNRADRGKVPGWSNLWVR